MLLWILLQRAAQENEDPLPWAGVGRSLLAARDAGQGCLSSPLSAASSLSRAGCSPCTTHLPRQPTSTRSFPGVAISTYAKYCYHKLQKAALTGAKKVHVSPGTA